MLNTHSSRLFTIKTTLIFVLIKLKFHFSPFHFAFLCLSLSPPFNSFPIHHGTKDEFDSIYHLIWRPTHINLPFFSCLFRLLFGRPKEKFVSGKSFPSLSFFLLFSLPLVPPTTLRHCLPCDKEVWRINRWSQFHFRLLGNIFHSIYAATFRWLTENVFYARVLQFFSHNFSFDFSSSIFLSQSILYLPWIMLASRAKKNQLHFSFQRFLLFLINNTSLKNEKNTFFSPGEQTVK